MDKKQREAVLEQLRGDDGRYRIRDQVAVTAFRGLLGEDIPDIDTLEIVDTDALTENDSSPFFTVLKIAQAGVTSGNNIYYGEAEANAIMQAVFDKRPTGGRGHLKWDEVESSLPANPVHWVGALARGEFRWGKAYVAPGETRDWLRRLAATRSEVATSIFGYAEEMFWDEDKEAYRIRGFTLEYIDLASPERAGVPSLAGQVEITTEMAGGAPPTQDIHEEETQVDKYQLLKELTAEDAPLLPQTVRDAVISTSEQAKTIQGLQAQIAELRGVLELEEGANVVRAVQGLQAQITETRKVAVVAKIAELVNDEETGVKVPSLKPIITEMVNDQKPQTVADAETAFEGVMARESVQALLKTAMVAEMGEPQRRPADNGQDPSGDVDKYFPVEEA